MSTPCPVRPDDSLAGPRAGSTSDPLAALDGRRALLDRLAAEIESTRRLAAAGSALLVLGLDRLKTINGSLSYAAGDQALVETSRRLAGAIRATDFLAHLGGDEFAILLSGLGQASEAQELAAEILDRLRWPIRLAQRQVSVTSSTGIVWIDEQYSRADEVLRDAEIAMERAKSSGRGRSELFDPSRHGAGVEQLKLATDLRGAIERGELRLHYQPIVELRSGRIRNFEALVRWHHPRRGLLRPREFISLADAIGLMPEICQWTLDNACRQLALWRQRFPFEPWTMSVNIDSRHLVEPGFVDRIDRILSRERITPSCLSLEITESAMLTSSHLATAVLHRLKDRGIQLHIDDFGTGYATLSYLHRIPGQAVKIDASFITRMLHDDRHLEIVRSIIGLAHNLDLEVVAEGVETPPQLRRLRKLGCDHGQGFYFSRPLEPESLEVLLGAEMQWIDEADHHAAGESAATD